MAEKRGSFGRMGFVLAAAGSAIGLGNIWKFPYITYENGGGSFVLVYLVAVALIGIPIMLSEILIGRHTALSPVGAMRQLGATVPGSKLWTAVGWLSIIGGGTILSYYSVIAGWTVYYFLKTLNWSLTGTFNPDTLGPEFG